MSEHKLTGNREVTLYHGDCLDIMDQMDDCMIDLTVTSPPYDNLRTYNDSLDWSRQSYQIAIDLKKEKEVMSNN